MSIALILYLGVFALVFMVGLLTGFRFQPSSVTALKSQKNSLNRGYIYFSVFLGILLVATCMLKPEEIADYEMYRYYYNALVSGVNPKSSLEPTYIWFSAICPTFEILIFFYAILAVGINLFVINRYSCNPFVSLLLYLSPYFVLHDMIQIRVAVSCALMLWAITYIPSKDWKRYLLIIAVAVLFHYSALFFVPFVLLSGKKINKILYSIIVVCLLVAAVVHISLGYLVQFIPIPALQAYYLSYAFTDTYTAQGVGVVIMGKCLMALWMIWKADRIQEVFPYAIISLKIFVISIGCYILLMDIPVMSGRLYEATAVIDVFALAMFPLVSTYWKKILVVVPIAFAFFRFPFAIALLTSTIE